MAVPICISLFTFPSYWRNSKPHACSFLVLCQQGSRNRSWPVVRRPSVRQCRNYLCRISLKILVIASTGPYAGMFLLFLMNPPSPPPHTRTHICHCFAIFFFVLVHIGHYRANISKRYSYKSQPKVFKLFLIFFLPMVLKIL